MPFLPRHHLCRTATRHCLPFPAHRPSPSAPLRGTTVCPSPPPSSTRSSLSPFSSSPSAFPRRLFPSFPPHPPPFSPLRSPPSFPSSSEVMGLHSGSRGRGDGRATPHKGGEASRREQGVETPMMGHGRVGGIA